MVNRNVTIPVATAEPKLSKIAKQEFLGTLLPSFTAIPYEPDISSSLGQVVTVHIAIGALAESIIEYTLDGVKYHSFLNGLTLKINSALERQITLRAGDKLNFRADLSVDLDYCFVDLV